MPSPHSEFLALATKLDNLLIPTDTVAELPEDVKEEIAIVAARTTLAFAVDLTNSLDRIAVTMSKMTQELSRIQARL